MTTAENLAPLTSLGKKKRVLTDRQKEMARERNKKYHARNKERKQAYYEANKEKFVEYERNRQLQKTYGITSCDYERMLSEQDGKCKMCGTNEPKTKGGKYFAVDHCHSTGVVRGLLCNHCNIALGFYEVRKDLIKEYLKEKQQ